MRAWLRIRWGNSDRSSSTSWMRPVRTIRDRSRSSGPQNTVSFTQYPSRISRSLSPNASNISTVRQATPSAWPSSSGPGLRSTIRVVMSPNAASWAASTSPAGPQPTISTSTSSGSAPCTPTAAGATSGSPGRNPSRWNCMPRPPPSDFNLTELNATYTE